MSLLALLQDLAATQGSIALHESRYMYSLVESVHVLTLGLFLGTLFMVDLRMLGVSFSATPIAQLQARLLPWTVAGFVIMVITGLLLFYAVPVRSYQNLFFRIKLVLLVLAGLNAWRYHRWLQRSPEFASAAARPPRGARVAAGVSLGVWAAVIFAGRMIAYNWFDCDLPQSRFITWAAGCVQLSPTP